jgi:type IX secretion system PorP/SprF family membrane protein
MKTIINTVFSALAITFISVNVIAQADPSYRNNQFNILMLNPAQSGANSYNDVSVLASKSLVGFTGAPRTLTASGSFRILDNVGLGLTAVNDQIGPMITTGGAINLAYHLKLDKQWRLAVGIKASVSNLTVDLPSLITTQDDPSMKTVLSSGIQAGTGWGALLYSKSSYFGIAQPNILKRGFQNVNMADYVNAQGIVAYTGTTLRVNNDYTFRPSMVVRYVETYPLYTNINAMFTYRSKFDIGVNYELGSNIGLTTGLEVDKKLYVGYSYNIPTTSMNRISMQAHEIVLRLKLNNQYGMSYKGPRFFN